MRKHENLNPLPVRLRELRNNGFLKSTQKKELVKFVEKEKK